jgi:hypothetical protein
MAKLTGHRERTPYSPFVLTGWEGVDMSRASDHFREQAERAERLARTISDEEASKRLAEASREFRLQAEQLDKRPDKSVLRRP